MSSNDRRGARKDRSSKIASRMPELGYYLIITDTEETEKNYFEGLRECIPISLRDRLVIRVEKARTTNLVKKTIELVSKESQLRIPWIIFDRDEVKDFDGIINQADSKRINVGWSNPCIEIWFFAYFGRMPVHSTSTSCINDFEKVYRSVVGQNYFKADKDLYKKLIMYGDEDKAVKISMTKLREFELIDITRPSLMCPSSTLHLLINEIINKIK